MDLDTLIFEELDKYCEVSGDNWAEKSPIVKSIDFHNDRKILETFLLKNLKDDLMDIRERVSKACSFKTETNYVEYFKKEVVPLILKHRCDIFK